MKSAIYTGSVRHRRYAPKALSFRYPLYMLALDLDELQELDQISRVFSLERFAPLSFRRKDYLGAPSQPLKAAVLSQVDKLGGDSTQISRVVMLGQVRCFGLYFSPVNFFFCYHKQPDNPFSEQPKYMLAEVRNTPWLERHCYLVDVNNPQQTQKAFHVSPFMDMAMKYHWRIRPPGKRALVHIENWRVQGETAGEKTDKETDQRQQSTRWFDATLALKRRPFNQGALAAALKQWPMMSLTIMRGIYWQALRLFKNRIPFYSHP